MMDGGPQKYTHTYTHTNNKTNVGWNYNNPWINIETFYMAKLKNEFKIAFLESSSNSK
jgi:hypothetical protein